VTPADLEDLRAALRSLPRPEPLLATFDALVAERDRLRAELDKREAEDGL
jgi:hypothetical protein